jgi:hypothetical protein
VARCYIRGANDFFSGARMLFRIVAFLFPFAFGEALTERNFLPELFAAILPSYPDAGNDMQAVFGEPKLFSSMRSCSASAPVERSPESIRSWATAFPCFSGG